MTFWFCRCSQSAFTRDGFSYRCSYIIRSIASVIPSANAIRIKLSIRRHSGIRSFRFVSLIRYSQIIFDSMISWPDSGSSAGILFNGLGLFLVATRSALSISITSNWPESSVI